MASPGKKAYLLRASPEVMAAVENRHWWYGGMRAIAAALLDTAYPDQRDLRILDAVSPFYDEKGATICRLIMFSNGVDHDGDRYAIQHEPRV